MQAFRPISKSEFEAERQVSLAPDHCECRSLPSGHAWLLRNVMPVNYDRYCAVLLPWEVCIDGERYALETFNAAYTILKRPIPRPLTLTTWHHDFRVSESSREISPILRSLLGRFSKGADLVFVRCSHVEEYYWTIDRALFLELVDPFWEMPQRFGHFDVFPRGASWYMVHRDDEPLLYLGGSAALVDAVLARLEDRALALGLDDRYF